MNGTTNLSKFDYQYSAVLCTFNAEKTIAESLLSILNQTHPPHEIVIIDDASSDSTRLIIESFIHIAKVNIKFVCNSENLGQSYGRNLGAKLSSGRIVIFFDDDDISDPKRAKEHLFMHRNDVQLSFVSSKKIYANGYHQNCKNRNVVKLDMKPDIWARKLLLGKSEPAFDDLWIPNSTLSIERDFFLKIEGYSREFRRLEDVDLILKSCEFKASASWSDLCLVNRHSTDAAHKGGEIETKYEKMLLEKYQFLLNFKEQKEAKSLILIRESYFQNRYFLFLLRVIGNFWILRSSFKRIPRFSQRLIHDLKKY